MNVLKKSFKKLPAQIKLFILKIIDNYYYIKYKKYANYTRNKTGAKRNILIYHPSLFGYGGTEKNLHLLGEILSSEYKIFFCGADQNSPNNRKHILEKYGTILNFTYTKQDLIYPHFIHQAKPDIFSLIEKYNFDLIITASSGRIEYPLNIVRDVPILLINIFGAPAVQKNILATYFNAEVTKQAAEEYTGKNKSYKVMRIPVIKESSAQTSDLKNRLLIPSKSFVFGRIGRSDDNIFDPIGLLAFKKVLLTHPGSYYVIVSPSKKAVDLVKKHEINNVIFLPTTTKEDELWDFHYGIDTLAHFRIDGETQGLNICEALYCGKPVITHRSKYWNGHLEYLDSSFSRVADIDNIEEYSKYMIEFIETKNNNPEKWEQMCQDAKKCANRNFNKQKYSEQTLSHIKSLIKNETKNI